MIVAETEEAIAVVETVNVAVFEPAGTNTEAGTVADKLLDVSATAMPPVGAAEASVIVPVELIPPVTELGETDNP